VFKFFNSAIISVLILACASHKNADVPQFFDYWVPFKFGKTYQGHNLEASVVKGDKLLQEKRYESAYAQYKEALTSFGSNAYFNEATEEGFRYCFI